jgi:hypothetical protein
MQSVLSENDIYKNKYLKYKNKYLELKMNIKGGSATQSIIEKEINLSLVKEIFDRNNKVDKNIKKYESDENNNFESKYNGYEANSPEFNRLKNELSTRLKNERIKYNINTFTKEVKKNDLFNLINFKLSISEFITKKTAFIKDYNIKLEKQEPEKRLQKIYSGITKKLNTYNSERNNNLKTIKDLNDQITYLGKLLQDINNQITIYRDTQSNIYTQINKLFKPK